MGQNGDMRYAIYDIVTGKTLSQTFIQKHLAEKVVADLNAKEPIGPITLGAKRWLVTVVQ